MSGRGEDAPRGERECTHTASVSMSLNEGMSPLMILQKMQLSSVCEEAAMTQDESCGARAGEGQLTVQRRAWRSCSARAVAAPRLVQASTAVPGPSDDER